LPVMMHPKLLPGDFLYLPRGTIHHAPNQDAKLPSVHLTISSFQRQSLFDLVQKSFEEAMSELWEDDESLRRSLPWRSLSTSSPDHAGIRSAVAQQLRRLADVVEEEAKGNSSGPVAGALAELGAEFVQHRMPPQASNDSSADSMALVSPSSRLFVPDPTSFAIVPLPGAEDAVKLVHCLGNSRQEHMMKHPSTDADHQDSFPPFQEEAEEEQLEEDEEESLDDDYDEDNAGQLMSAHAADTIRCLCSSTTVESLESTFRKAGVPKSSWPEVCNVMTQLLALGLVQESEDAAAATPAEGPNKKKSKKRKLAKD